jgi:hypothetical protein
MIWPSPSGSYRTLLLFLEAHQQTRTVAVGIILFNITKNMRNANKNEPPAVLFCERLSPSFPKECTHWLG